VEYHPLTKRKELPDFCEQEGIILTAYCPIARGKVFSYETITKIGQKYGKSAAQVSLKWLLQKGHVVIPKSASDDHLKANIELGDFELSQDDMKAIDNIEAQERLVDSQYT
jgi:diketogulonate reductase-like aldo/keto reductase